MQYASNFTLTPNDRMTNQKNALCHIHNQQLDKGGKERATYQGTQEDSLILAYDLAMGVDLAPAIYNAYNKQ